VMQPSARAQLRKAGPWLALGIFFLCTLPVVIWNTQHNWITITHVAGDAGLTGHNDHPVGLAEHLSTSLGYFIEFTGSEFFLLNPIFFIGAVWAMFAVWPRRREKPLWLFLWCMSAPLFLGHWLYSLHSRVQPNWIAAAVPPMFCLMAAYWQESTRKVKPLFATGLLIGIVASVFMYDSALVGRLTGHKLPGDKDIHRVLGWRETALAVEAEREKFDANAFIIADHYGTTGLFSFYSPRARAAATTGMPLVYCIDSDAPINQFPFWDEYNYREHRQGENAIYVVRLDPYALEKGWLGKWWRHEQINALMPPERPVPTRLTAEFESVTNLGVREIALHDGRVFQRVQIFGCYHLK